MVREHGPAYPPAIRSTAERDDPVKRPTPKSFTALLLSLVFLLSTAGESFGARLCAQHDAGAERASHEASADCHGHAAEDLGASDSHDHDVEPCTCTGSCLPGVASPLPQPAIRLRLAPAAIGPVPQPAPRADVPRARLLPHILPFAQAPPAA